MRQTSFKTYIKQKYNSAPTLLYIITVAVAFFVLLNLSNALNLFDGRSLSTDLSITPRIMQWLTQPWTILSYPFIYVKIFPLIFDCLWLYWIGNMLLNLLPKKDFLNIFFGGLFYGALVFLLLNTIPFLVQSSTPLSSMSNGIAALFGAMIILSPKTEVRLALLGNLNLKTIAILYCSIELLSLVYNEQYTQAITIIFAASTGLLYILSSQKEINWHPLLRKKTKNHLKVIHRQENTVVKNDTPNQEIIDQILDKISANGYDSLSKKEKETLFKLGNKN